MATKPETSSESKTSNSIVAFPLPESEKRFTFFKQIPVDCLPQGLDWIQKQATETKNYFEGKIINWKADILKTLQRLQKSKDGCKELIEHYSHGLEIQENLDITTTKTMQSAEEKIKSQKGELIELDNALKTLIVEQEGAQKLIDQMIQENLKKCTKDITEPIITEIHYILSNDQKDPNEIDVVRSLVSILKNSMTADHITVNSYLTHYEGLLQKFYGFTGESTKKEVAIAHMKMVDSFCSKFDDSLPANKGKSIPKKYKYFVVLARWVKLAAEIALKQYDYKIKDNELQIKRTNKPIIKAIIEQLALVSSESIEQIKEIRETKAKMTELIDRAKKRERIIEEEEAKFKKKLIEIDVAFLRDVNQRTGKTKKEITDLINMKIKKDEAESLVKSTKK